MSGFTTYYFVAGDIGGTNSRLELWKCRVQKKKIIKQELISQLVYSSSAYASMSDLISRFLGEVHPNGATPFACCLAVAGPVENNTVKITNLSFTIDGGVLSHDLRIPHVTLINDFVGNGYGLLALQSSEKQLVSASLPERVGGPKACIGAGTGLGEAFLTFNTATALYDVWPAEGGHTDFAPRNKLEYELMEHIKTTSNIDRVSVERVVSGLGLPKIYEFLANKQPSLVNEEVMKLFRHKLSEKQDVGPLLSQAACDARCPIAVQSLDLFMQLYGSEAGNLALKTLPFGGVYIAGGIAGKNQWALYKNNQFLENFLSKGRMRQEVLEKIPIYLITHEQVGLLGSKVVCNRIIEREALSSKL